MWEYSHLFYETYEWSFHSKFACKYFQLSLQKNTLMHTLILLIQNGENWEAEGKRFCNIKDRKGTQNLWSVRNQSI